MKRKLLALLTAVLMMIAMVTPAFADIIWEPEGNSFYESHSGECSYHNRSYLANGEKGYVTVRTAPDSLTEVVNIANGTLFFAVHVWTDKDGTQWGVGYPAGQWKTEGWVKLSEMAMIYDYISFEEDHGDEFQTYDGSVDGLTEACSYSYPGGVYRSKMENWSGGDFILSDCFDVLYTDENGLRWSYVGYYFGNKNFWVCIDDPMNEELGIETSLTVGQVRGGETLIPADQPSDPDVQEPQPSEELIPPAEDIPPAKTLPMWLIPVILVIAVAVVTALIVRKRRKKS